MNFNINKFAQKLAIIFLIVLALEIVVFNFPFWESLSFDKNISGIVSEYTANENDNAEGYAIVSGITGHVSNIYLDLFTPEAHKGDKITVAIGITDQANKNCYWLPETEIINGIDESSYIRLRTNGDTEVIYITVVSSDSGYAFSNTSVDINKTRPFEMHLGRILMVYMIFVMGMLFMPGSVLYKTKLDFKDKMQKDLVFVLVFLQIITFMEIGLFNRKFDKASLTYNEMQYNLYGEALSDGVSYLYQVETPETIAKLENPYDAGVRTTVVGDSYEGLSYYQGKFYSHLGLLPALVFFMPYHKITGSSLDPAYAMILVVALLAIAVFRLVYVIANKYFSDISYGVYLLISYVVLIGAGSLSFVKDPVASNLPVVLSVLLIVTGLNLWMTSNNGQLSTMKLILGSLCFAFVMGCTPVMAISFLLVFPVFTMEMREKKLFSKTSIFDTLCVVMPFVVISFIFLLYNFMRFGNFFEFGTSYLLTNTDMLHHGFKMSLIPLGLFDYLFLPMNISPTFPYVAPSNNISGDYMAVVNYGSMIGGFFAFNIVALASLLMFIPSIRKMMKERNVFVYAFDVLFYGVVILLSVIQRGGISMEFISQFGIFIVIAMAFVLFTLMSNEKISGNKTVLAILVLAGVLCIITNYWLVLARSMDSFVYYNFKYLAFALR
ncbi:MAG: hypothetical protein MJ093_04190 [Saccharofermentans sp.]|nr:hypothetical protein [Saccharofermentans sp.]